MNEILDKYLGRVAFKTRWLTWSPTERCAYLWAWTGNDLKTRTLRFTLRDVENYGRDRILNQCCSSSIAVYVDGILIYSD